MKKKKRLYIAKPIIDVKVGEIVFVEDDLINLIYEFEINPRVYQFVIFHEATCLPYKSNKYQVKVSRIEDGTFIIDTSFYAEAYIAPTPKHILGRDTYFLAQQVDNVVFEKKARPRKKKGHQFASYLEEFVDLSEELDAYGKLPKGLQSRFDELLGLLDTTMPQWIDTFTKITDMFEYRYYLDEKIDMIKAEYIDYDDEDEDDPGIYDLSKVDETKMSKNDLAIVDFLRELDNAVRARMFHKLDETPENIKELDDNHQKWLIERLHEDEKWEVLIKLRDYDSTLPGLKSWKYKATGLSGGLFLYIDCNPNCIFYEKYGVEVL